MEQQTIINLRKDRLMNNAAPKNSWKGRVKEIRCLIEYTGMRIFIAKQNYLHSQREHMNTK